MRDQRWKRWIRTALAYSNMQCCRVLSKSTAIPAGTSLQRIAVLNSDNKTCVAEFIYLPFSLILSPSISVHPFSRGWLQAGLLR